MNVLGISGTPRKNGNSHILLEHSLAPFKESGWDVTILGLHDLTVQPCKACDHCRSYNGKCIIEDDMGLFYDAFRRCHALIVSTPVYYRNVSAQLKAVFDRHYAVTPEQPLRGKPGGAIAVGAGQGGGQAMTLAIVHNWFSSCGALTVPGELNGVSAVAQAEGDILKQEKRLKQARILGENVLQVAVKLNSEQVGPPDAEKWQGEIREGLTSPSPLAPGG